MPPSADRDLTDRIVHEDDRLIALDKPSGMPAVRDGSLGEDRSVHAWVSAYLGLPALVVHRLDLGTSGLIVFAKDRETHRRLSVAFEERAVRKTYLALVLGNLEAASGEIDLRLRTFGSGRVAADPRGRPASTRYRVRERLLAVDLVEAIPATGRHHQVRAHLYAIGHPILGDPLYGSPRPVGGAERLMLHAVELTLPAADPSEGALSLIATPGADFDAVVRRYRPTAGGLD
jgi:RluA family pseudouridine synthase